MAGIEHLILTRSDLESAITIPFPVTSALMVEGGFTEEQVIKSGRALGRFLYDNAALCFIEALTHELRGAQGSPGREGPRT